MRNLEEVLAQRTPDALLEHALVGDPIRRAPVQGLEGSLAGLLEYDLGGLVEDEAAVDDVGPGQHLPAVGVHGHHHHDDPVAGELASVTQDRLADVPDAQPVDEGHPRLHALAAAQDLTDLDGVPVLADKDALIGDAHLAGEARVVGEVSELPVNGNEPPRPDEVQHELELLGCRMPGDVHGSNRHVKHVRTRPVEPIERAMDRRLVPGDDRRGQDDRVTALELHPLVLV